jgi:hypothetical protein
MLWDVLLIEQSVATPDELRPALPIILGAFELLIKC